MFLNLQYREKLSTVIYMEENKKPTGTYEASSHDAKRFLKQFPGEIIPVSEAPDFKLTLLPAEFNHLRPEHASPMADEKLTSISEQIHGHPDQASFIDLQQIVHFQKADLLLQKDHYEKKNPDWNKQKDLLKFAYAQFQLPPSTVGDEINLSLDTSQPEPEIKSGREPGKEAYKFKRNKILNQYMESQLFESQQKYFENIEEAALTMMEGENPLNRVQKRDTIVYLKKEKRRWNSKKDSAPHGSIDWATAKCNEDVLSALFEKVEKYPSEDSVTDDELQLVENFANDEAHELESQINDVIAGAEAITHGTTSKKDTERNRQQPPPGQD
jgi:hypothetical protein